MKKSVLLTPSALAVAIASTNSWSSTCNPGQYDPANGSDCVTADPGFFVASAGATAQTPAQMGRFVGVSGATSDTLCAAGSFAASFGQSACDPAPLGRFVASTGESEAIDCDTGTFAGETGLAVCSDASPGSFVSAVGASQSDFCPVGRFSSVFGSSACEAAPEGRFVGSVGLTQASQCPEGKFTGTSGQSVCDDAPAGTFVPGVGASESISCAIGTFSNEAGRTTCNQASPGSFVGSIGASNTEQCPAGEYTSLFGASECFSAPEGSFVGSEGATEFAQCDAGTFSDSVGQSACTRAERGKFVASSGATVSESCEVGKFTATTGQSICESAPLGSFVNSIGASDAAACDPGTFAGSVGLTVCQEALPGSFVGAVGASSSQSCSVGSFSGLAGSSVCEPAAPGSFVSFTGATGLQQCAPGTFSSEEGSSECTDAPAGSFINSTGASEAAACELGTFADSVASTECQDSLPGSFVGVVGASSSQSCSAGTFSDSARSTICTPAVPGSFVSSTGATGIQQCVPGTFSSEDGSSECTDAPAGSFVSGPGATGPLACSPGRFSSSAAQTLCNVAVAGSFVENAGATESVLCLPGSFSELEGATSCELAPVGFFVANSGATLAAECPAGKYTEAEGARECIDFRYGEINVSSNSFSVDEDDSSIDISVIRTSGDDGVIEVDFFLQDGSANATEDYEFVSGTLVFGDGEVSKIVNVVIEDDDIYEQDETFLFTLNNFVGEGGGLGSTMTSTITIVNDDAQPPSGVISFSETSALIGEDENAIILDVVREMGTFGEVSVSYNTVDVTAIAGSDYSARNGIIVFADGEILQTVTVPIVDDTNYEPTESLSIELGDIQGGAVLDENTAEISIIDDDPVPESGVINFASANYSSEEDSGSIEFVLNRTGGTFGALSVTVSSSENTATPGTDYLFPSTVVEFGPEETSQTLVVTIVDDDVHEGSETFDLILTGETQVLGELTNTSVTIADDDPIPLAGVIQFSDSNYIVDENQLNYSITLTRINGSDGELTATVSIEEISADENVDFLLQENELVFDDGVLSRTIDLEIINDLEYEGDETVELTIAEVDGGASIGVPNQTTLTIRDNESPPDSGVVNFSGSELSVNEGAGSVVLTVVRSGGTFGELSVDYSVTDASSASTADFLLADGTIVYADGEIEKNITLNIVDDSDEESNEDIIVELTNNQGGAIGTRSTLKIVIVDNDTPTESSSSGGGVVSLWLLLFNVLLFPFQAVINRFRFLKRVIKT